MTRAAIIRSPVTSRKACLLALLLGCTSLFVVPRMKAKELTSNGASLTVSLFNDATVPSEVVIHAMQTASQVFARAGIRVQWMLCGRTEETPEEQLACVSSGLRHLHIRIRHTCAPGTDPATLGMSFLSADGSGFQADVFFGQVQKLRGSGWNDQALLLGHAMAHELGHLLLGTHSHSPSGLMRASWSLAELNRINHGALDFNSNQSEQIRLRLLPAASLNRVQFSPSSTD